MASNVLDTHKILIGKPEKKLPPWKLSDVLTRRVSASFSKKTSIYRVNKRWAVGV